MKKNYLYLLILLSSLLFAQTIGEAINLYKKKQYKKAIEIFQNFPENNESQYYLAGAYLNGLGVDKNISKAIIYYKEALKQNNMKACISLGQLYQYTLKDYKKAEEYFMQAVNGENKAQAYANLGDLYRFNLQDYKDAIKYYAKALKNGINKGAGFYNIGRVYLINLNNYEKARFYYEKAIESGYKEVYIELGTIYLTQQKDSLAEKYYKKAIDIGDKKAYELLGTVYFGQHKYNLAEKYYKKAIELGYYQPYYNFTLGAIYLAQQKYSLAEKYYKKAIDIGDKKAYALLASVYSIENKYILAKKYYKQAIELNTTINKCDLADCYLKLGDEEHAYKIAKKMLKTEPKSIQLSQCYNVLGAYYSGINRPRNIDKAIQYFKLASNNPYVLTDLYLEKGDFKQAVKWHKKGYLDLSKTSFFEEIKNITNKDVLHQNIFPILDIPLLHENKFIEDKNYCFFPTGNKSVLMYDKEKKSFTRKFHGYIGDGFKGAISDLLYDKKKNLLLTVKKLGESINIIDIFDLKNSKLINVIRHKGLGEGHFRKSEDGKVIVMFDERGLYINPIDKNRTQEYFNPYAFSGFISNVKIKFEKNDYFIYVLTDYDLLYTFSVKERKRIKKQKFNNQVTFQKINNLSESTCKQIYLKNRHNKENIQNIYTEKNMLFIQCAQNKYNFDMDALSLSEYKNASTSKKSNKKLHIKFEHNKGILKIYNQKNKLMSKINLLYLGCKYYKILNNKYIFIATKNIEYQFIFNINGNLLCQLTNINDFQKDAYYKNGYLYTFGTNNIINIFNVNLEGLSNLPVKLDSFKYGNAKSLIKSVIKDQDKYFGKSSNYYFGYMPTSKEIKKFVMIEGLQKRKIVKPLASLYIKNNNDWIMYTPEGLFTYDGKGKDLLKYHQNQGLYKEARIVVNDRLFDKFYRPDLIKKILAGKKVTIPMDVKSVLLNIKPPKLSLLQHNMLNDKDVELTYQICDAGNGIADPKLLINGQAINPPSSRGFSIKKIKLKNKSCKIYRSVLTLDPGTNTISFKAYDKDKNIANSSKILKIVANYIINNQIKTYSSQNVKTDASEQKGELYFLTIAISNYEKSEYDLKYSVKDAEAIQESYLAKNKNSFNHIHKYNLYDSNVSKEALTNTFDEISKKIKYGDTFLLYIAGHGTYKDGKYQLIPYKISSKISIDFLKNNFSKIYTNKYLVMLDTCKSGAAIDSIYDEATKNRLAHDSAKINYIVSSCS
ncbi:tetratricopeptide repeat protein [Sulfurimonas hydrogeniphila]|uniref:tetratricopeptide repeat protein n=1 Tax=Sulfurimonas hydrogeniphila TaxID=2509341 RepID=UPI00125F61C8|nr:tetratricopeptide repeat protein [Sulfurimonas hydrogeniphila]